MQALIYTGKRDRATETDAGAFRRVNEGTSMHSGGHPVLLGTTSLEGPLGDGYLTSPDICRCAGTGKNDRTLEAVA